jgi:hypothetical protein
MKTKRIVALFVAVVMLVSLCCGCGKAATSSEPSSGTNVSEQVQLNKITVTIKFKDGEEKKLELETDKKFLGEVLFEQKLVNEEEYKTGFYSYIDGVRADYNEDKAWWCVYENGESAMVGINEIVVDNGDEFQIVHTPA